uniref:Uncharacterized protein n=1 Tax=Lotharella globosa TaxID=91324 RepID=A0A7S4DWD3_9EUKA
MTAKARIPTSLAEKKHAWREREAKGTADTKQATPRESSPVHSNTRYPDQPIVGLGVPAQREDGGHVTDTPIIPESKHHERVDSSPLFANLPELEEVPSEEAGEGGDASESFAGQFFHQLWKFHPWTSHFTVTSDDRHTSFERLVVFGLQWTGAIALCGLYLSRYKGARPSIQLGAFAAVCFIPMAKFVNYILAKSDSKRKRQICRREPEKFPRPPPLHSAVRNIVLVLCVCSIFGMSFANILSGLRLGVEDHREMEWIESSVLGLVLSAILVEPVILLVDVAVGRRKDLSWLSTCFRATATGSDVKL